jgi:hypothetical protein
VGSDDGRLRVAYALVRNEALYSGKNHKSIESDPIDLLLI